MGFFADKKRADKGPSVELLHALECRACPLNKIKANRNPHMEPTGSDKPLVYILGEAPGKDEDIRNEQFVGQSGKLLRVRIPKRYGDKVRFNNCARTRPPGNATPDKLTLECCRPSVERDIKATKPRIILGFGGVPLSWATGQTGVQNWRGRRIPVNIGGHDCWFYPMLHPSFLLRRRWRWAKQRGPEVIGSEYERAFAFDMKRAFADLVDLPDPVVHDRKVAEYGVEIYPGGPGQFEKVKKSLEWAMKQKAAGVDYEANCLRPYRDNSKILAVGVGTAEVSFSFALYHKQNKWTKTERKELVKLWKQFLKSPARKIVHNLSNELEWSGYHFGWDTIIEDTWDCTMMQACTLDERTGRDDEGKRKKNKDGGPLSLNFLCKQHFGLGIKSLSKVNLKDLDNDPIEVVLKYNAIDAKYHFLLGQAQDIELTRYNLNKSYRRGLKRVSTCALTQLKGIPVDPEETMRLHYKYSRGIKKARKEIAALKDVKKFNKTRKEPFNPLSDDDCVTMFKDQLKRKEGWYIDKDKYGQEVKKYSTDKNVLARIDHPLAPLILTMRNLTKKQNTYLYYTQEDAADDPKNRTVSVWSDWMIHTHLNPGFFTETFRLSSDEPNLQNIPKRTEGNQEIRRQIVAPKDHVIVAIDYGQIEHRVIAMASRDKATVDALWNDYDVHGAWAKTLAYAYPPRIGGKAFIEDSKVMKAFRTDVKNQWTFPLFFGAKVESAAGYLKIPVQNVQRPYRDFKREFKGVFKWQEELVEFYNEHGYVENLFGRRRRAPLSLNAVINSPIQSTAGELVLDAMNRHSQMARETGDWYFQPHLQIHDELIWFLPRKKLDYYLEPIIDIMLDMKFKFVNVPILAEVSIGTNLMPFHAERNPEGMKEAFKAQSNTWKGVPKYDKAA